MTLIIKAAFSITVFSHSNRTHIALFLPKPKVYHCTVHKLDYCNYCNILQVFAAAPRVCWSPPLFIHIISVHDLQ
jgi:hypothetical protein